MGLGGPRILRARAPLKKTWGSFKRNWGSFCVDIRQVKSRFRADIVMEGFACIPPPIPTEGPEKPQLSLLWALIWDGGGIEGGRRI